MKPNPPDLSRERLKQRLEATVISMNAAPWARKEAADTAMSIVDDYVKSLIAYLRPEEKSFNDDPRSFNEALDNELVAGYNQAARDYDQKVADLRRAFGIEGGEG